MRPSNAIRCLLLLVAAASLVAVDGQADFARYHNPNARWEASGNIGIALALIGIVIALCVGVVLTSGRSASRRMRRTRRRPPPSSYY